MLLCEFDRPEMSIIVMHTYIGGFEDTVTMTSMCGMILFVVKCYSKIELYAEFLFRFSITNML